MTPPQPAYRHWTIERIELGNETTLLMFRTATGKGSFLCPLSTFETAMLKVEPTRRGMLREFYGLACQRPRSCAEIGHDWLLSRQRVHQQVQKGCQQLIAALWEKP